MSRRRCLAGRHVYETNWPYITKLFVAGNIITILFITGAIVNTSITYRSLMFAEPKPRKPYTQFTDDTMNFAVSHSLIRKIWTTRRSKRSWDGTLLLPPMAPRQRIFTSTDSKTTDAANAAASSNSSSPSARSRSFMPTTRACIHRLYGAPYHSRHPRTLRYAHAPSCQPGGSCGCRDVFGAGHCHPGRAKADIRCPTSNVAADGAWRN
ncbi:hypothetical protein B0H13DRAFT_1025949 [Mycena leptocephala]|nr:hypothetical protein B0H13DRAFT_1025949 [Mycena leptocephala]